MNGFGRGEENQKKDRASVFTRETVGMTLLLFSAVLLLIAVVGRFMLGSIGVAINAFVGGLFGFLTYPVLILLLYFSVVLVFGKKFLPAKWVGLFTALLGAVFLVVHLATSERFCGEGYGAYLSGCWKAASESMAGATGGGVVFGLLVYPVRALLSSAGAYVVFVCVILTALYLIARQTPLKKYISNRSYAERKSGAEKNAPKERVTADGVRAYPAAVAFDDLPPARPAQDYREAPRPQTSEPVRLAYGDGASENAADRLSGRDILFTTDPATSYKNNLIFDRDSRFNTSPRRSSVLSERKETLRDEPQESVYPFSPERTEKKSYLDDYSVQAEAPRPTMPRKITEERQAPQGGYSYPIRSDEDVNYPQKPSYKAEPVAPKEEPQPARDYYSNDVPYEEEFSSAPNVSDQADVSAPEREESLPAPRTESVRPSFTAQAVAEEEDSPRKFPRCATKRSVRAALPCAKRRISGKRRPSRPLIPKKRYKGASIRSAYRFPKRKRRRPRKAAYSILRCAAAPAPLPICSTTMRTRKRRITKKFPQCPRRGVARSAEERLRLKLPRNRFPPSLLLRPKSTSTNSTFTLRSNCSTAMTTA